MKRVHKFEVPNGKAAIEMPKGADLLHVATQPKAVGVGVFLWTLIDPDAAWTVREIGYFATGEEIPDGSAYIGTAVTPDRAFVWHVFEGRPPRGES